MPRLAALLLLLAACSSSGPDDALDDDGGSSGDSGGAEGDEGETGSSGGESEGSSGEPVPEWPPACLDEGTCAGFELVLDSEECGADGVDLVATEAFWYRSDEQISAVADCGAPVRTSGAPGIYNLRIALTYETAAAKWVCVYDEGGGGSEGPSEPGDVHAWERSISALSLFPNWDGGLPEDGAQGSGCCLLSGTPDESQTQTPCEGA